MFDNGSTWFRIQNAWVNATFVSDVSGEDLSDEDIQVGF